MSAPLSLEFASRLAPWTSRATSSAASRGHKIKMSKAYKESASGYAAGLANTWPTWCRESARRCSTALWEIVPRVRAAVA